MRGPFKMPFLFFKRIHPQFALGVFLGLSVTLLIHTQQRIDLVYNVSRRLANDRQDVKTLMRQNGEEKDVAGDERFPHDNVNRFHDTGQSLQQHKFGDSHVHHDDEALAQALYKQVRVLCWIMTSPTSLYKKAIHVRDTWARRCNVMLFMSSMDDPDFPAVGLNVSEGRQHLTAKTMQAFSYIYDNHFHDAEWFLKADDDTYVIVENLRFLLSGENCDEAVFFGHRFKPFTSQGYTSGGGGYVLSKEALKRFGEKGRNDPALCRPDKGAEDAQMGICLQRLGVVLKSSLDSLGRSRFHCFNSDAMVNKKFPGWYFQYDSEGQKGGVENISDYAISFHYMSPEKMYSMEFYTYHLQAYGIINRPQNLNLKS